MEEDLPANVGKHLGDAIADAEDSLRPADPKVVMIELDRLFAQFPMPDKAGMDGWKRELRRYPADLIADAVDEVIRTHVWENPPKIAEVVTRIRPEAIERQAWLNRLRTASLKLRMTPIRRSTSAGTDAAAAKGPMPDRLAALIAQTLAALRSPVIDGAPRPIEQAMATTAPDQPAVPKVAPCRRGLPSLKDYLSASGRLPAPSGDRP